MRIDTDVIELRWRRHAIFQPGDGTRYVITTIPDPDGGIFVIVHGNTLYRWYKDGQITYLGGKHEENKYTIKAICNFLKTNPALTIWGAPNE